MEQANSNGSAVNKQQIHRSEEEILKHLSDQEESEISVKEYCGMFDINEQVFNSWVKKYRSKEKGFAQVRIIPSSSKEPVLFAEVGGIRLYREVSAEFLKALLQ